VPICLRKSRHVKERIGRVWANDVIGSKIRSAMTPNRDLWLQNHARFHVESAGSQTARTGLMNLCKAINKPGGTATLQWPIEPVSEQSLVIVRRAKLNLRLIAAKNIFHSPPVGGSSCRILPISRHFRLQASQLCARSLVAIATPPAPLAAMLFARIWHR
jgi:hypothetical protein